MFWSSRGSSERCVAIPELLRRPLNFKLLKRAPPRKALIPQQRRSRALALHL